MKPTWVGLFLKKPGFFLNPGLSKLWVRLMPQLTACSNACSRNFYKFHASNSDAVQTCVEIEQATNTREKNGNAEFVGVTIRTLCTPALSSVHPFHIVLTDCPLLQSPSLQHGAKLSTPAFSTPPFLTMPLCPLPQIRSHLTMHRTNGPVSYTHLTLPTILRV